jgi:hypothetical protein
MGNITQRKSVVTEFSGQPSCPIFKAQALLYCLTCQKRQALLYTAVEASNSARWSVCTTYEFFRPLCHTREGSFPLYNILLLGNFFILLKYILSFPARLLLKNASHTVYACNVFRSMPHSVFHCSDLCFALRDCEAHSGPHKLPQTRLHGLSLEHL